MMSDSGVLPGTTAESKQGAGREPARTGFQPHTLNKPHCSDVSHRLRHLQGFKQTNLAHGPSARLPVKTLKDKAE
jgi:hypothetical protein